MEAIPREGLLEERLAPRHVPRRTGPCAWIEVGKVFPRPVTVSWMLEHADLTEERRGVSSSISLKSVSITTQGWLVYSG